MRDNRARRKGGKKPMQKTLDVRYRKFVESITPNILAILLSKAGGSIDVSLDELDKALLGKDISVKMLPPGPGLPARLSVILTEKETKDTASDKTSEDNDKV